MKTISAICLLVSTSLVWTANVDRRIAEEECGALGVMEAPASAYANGGVVRKCRDHPLGNPPAPLSEKRDDNPLLGARQDRCPNPLNAPWGCTRGYCWKGCALGYKWCWTAGNYGRGDWARCTRGGDCGFDDMRFSCSGGCGC